MLLSSGYFHYLNVILNKHLFLYLGSCLGDPWSLGLEIPTEVSKRVCFLGNGLIFVSIYLFSFPSPQVISAGKEIWVFIL